MQMSPVQNLQNLMPFKLFQINGSQSGSTYFIPVRKDERGTIKAILGRSTPGAPVEVSFNEHTISRMHAELIYNGEILEFWHLSQNNNSYVNNEHIGAGKIKYLKINDVITLANIQFKLIV
jgi:pSer/pThr/pTyr-binding forkhead associated (FHA) protein